jgi:hypothetical protein
MENSLRTSKESPVARLLNLNKDQSPAVRSGTQAEILAVPAPLHFGEALVCLTDKPGTNGTFSDGLVGNELGYQA